MASHSFDLLIIGAGPTGEAAAMSAVKAGLSVAVVDDKAMVGGNCTHRGTIPSKSLRQAVKELISVKKRPVARLTAQPVSVTYSQVLDAAKKVIPKQVEMRSHFFARNQVAVFQGRASFLNENEVFVQGADGVKENIHAKYTVIATGSRPYRPDSIDFNHKRVFDSDTILDMPISPRSLTIYGAGVIGCEYASIFAGLGIKVDLINSRASLLEFLDDEISDALSYHLRKNGVLVRHNEIFESVTLTDNGVVFNLESGKKIKSDALLWCNGRSGNTDSLGLDKVGLEANHRGQLTVDKQYRTAINSIFAAGDVIGWPSLASASYDQGRAIVDVITDSNPRFIEDAPTGIYTIPEISSVGKTESELTAAKVPYEVGRALFKDTARGQISGEDVGMLKILFHVDTFEILGIHCFGAEASEIIHIGQAIMSQTGEANTVEYFVNTTFNYPTMAEAYRVAALNGLNRVRRSV